MTDYKKAAFHGILVLIAMALFYGTVQASGPRVEELKAEIDRLKLQSAKQTKVIVLLARRLKRMEKFLQSGRPSPPTAKHKKAETNPAQRNRRVERKPETVARTKPIKTGAKGRDPKVQTSKRIAKAPERNDNNNKTPNVEETRPDSVSKPRMKESMRDVLTDGRSLIQNKLSIETGLRYSHTSRQQVSLSGFLALDTIFIGEISVDEVESDILQFNITPRYGLSDRLEVDLDLPFLYRNTTFRNTGTGGQDNGPSEADRTMNFEFGDLSAGLYYKLFQEHDWVPDVVWNIRAKAPTGSDPFGIKTTSQGDLQFPERFPSGNGVWALSTGISFVKTSDPTILFANIAYFHNFERSFDDISSDPNRIVPGSVRIGDSFQYGIGFALAFNEKTSFSLSYSQLFTQATEIKPEGGDWSKSIGSDANSASLNFGLTYALDDHLSFVANVSAGLTPDAPDVEVGLKFPYTF